MLFRDTSKVENTRQQIFGFEQLRTDRIQAAFPSKHGNGGGSRASVYEAHHRNVANTMGKLREMGHRISKVEHYDYNKSPNPNARRAAEGGMLMRSVIRHRSGNNKLKTTVRTAFNMEGGDHQGKVETGPDNDGKKRAKVKKDGGDDKK